MDNEFDDIPDMTPSGTIERTLSHAFVHSTEPLVLVMKHASATWNPDYGNAQKKRAAELEATYDKNDEETRRRIIAEIWSQTIFVGWKNCNGKDGQPLPYTPERAVVLLAMLAQKGLKDQLDGAMLAATTSNNFRTSPAAAVAALGK